MLDAPRKSDSKPSLEVAVQALADEIHPPIEIVQVVYERELIALHATARIKGYVALPAGRRMREALLRGRR